MASHNQQIEAGLLDSEFDLEASTSVEGGDARGEEPVAEVSVTKVADEAIILVACSGGLWSIFTWLFKLLQSVKGREHTVQSWNILL